MLLIVTLLLQLHAGVGLAKATPSQATDGADENKLSLCEKVAHKQFISRRGSASPNERRYAMPDGTHNTYTITSAETYINDEAFLACTNAARGDFAVDRIPDSAKVFFAKYFSKSDGPPPKFVLQEPVNPQGPSIVFQCRSGLPGFEDFRDKKKKEFIQKFFRPLGPGAGDNAESKLRISNAPTNKSHRSLEEDYCKAGTYYGFGNGITEFLADNFTDLPRSRAAAITQAIITIDSGEPSDDIVAEFTDYRLFVELFDKCLIEKKVSPETYELFRCARAGSNLRWAAEIAALLSPAGGSAKVAQSAARAAPAPVAAGVVRAKTAIVDVVNKVLQSVRAGIDNVGPRTITKARGAGPTKSYPGPGPTKSSSTDVKNFVDTPRRTRTAPSTAPSPPGASGGSTVVKPVAVGAITAGVVWSQLLPDQKVIERIILVHALPNQQALADSGLTIPPKISAKYPKAKWKGHDCDDQNRCKVWVLGDVIPFVPRPKPPPNDQKFIDEYQKYTNNRKQLLDANPSEVGKKDPYKCERDAFIQGAYRDSIDTYNQGKVEPAPTGKDPLFVWFFDRFLQGIEEAIEVHVETNPKDFNLQLLCRAFLRQLFLTKGAHPSGNLSHAWKQTLSLPVGLGGGSAGSEFANKTSLDRHKPWDAWRTCKEKMPSKCWDELKNDLSEVIPISR